MFSLAEWAHSNRLGKNSAELERNLEVKIRMKKFHKLALVPEYFHTEMNAKLTLGMFNTNLEGISKYSIENSCRVARLWILYKDFFQTLDFVILG